VNAAIGEPQDHLPQIVQVAGQPIHGVTDDCIALTHVPRQLFKLWSVEILARSLLYKPLVELDAIELPQLFLIERADAAGSPQFRTEWPAHFPGVSPHAEG